MRTLIALTLAAPLLWSTAGAHAQLNARQTESAREFLRRLDALGFDGVVVASVKGKPALAESCGYADRERRIEWSPEIVSTIGSITKPMTGVAILKLQEQGELDVQDPIADHIEGVPEDKRSITIHHLLTHSSGITEPRLGDHDPVTREEYLAMVFDAPLESAPGERYSYSNAGYSLLAAIIEFKSGMSYEQWMQAEVFEPAGLERTGYKLADWSDSTLAIAYMDGERWGTVVERPMADDGPYWALRGNGGIHMPASEMLLWAEALMDGEIISEESLELAWTPHVDESNGQGGGSYYGYGFVVQETPMGTLVTHNGGNGRHGADLLLVPDRDLVLFAQSNVIADSSLVFQILPMLGAAMFTREGLPELPDVVEMGPALAGSLAGRYELENGGELELVEQHESLAIVLDGDEATSAFLSSGSFELETLEQRSRDLQRIFDAAAGGDYEAMREAYGIDTPASELAEAYDGRIEMMEQSLGAFDRYQVAGSWAGDDTDHTFIRAIFENGESGYHFLWTKDGRLRGRIPGDTSANRVTLFAGTDGSLHTFDERSMSSQRIGVAFAGDSATLRLPGGESAVQRR